MKSSLYFVIIILGVCLLSQINLTRRANARADRAMQQSEDWRITATNFQAALRGWVDAVEGWRTTATNCMAKYEELIVAVENRNKP